MKKHAKRTPPQWEFVTIFAAIQETKKDEDFIGAFKYNEQKISWACKFTPKISESSTPNITAILRKNNQKLTIDQPDLFFFQKLIEQMVMGYANMPKKQTQKQISSRMSVQKTPEVDAILHKYFS